MYLLQNQWEEGEAALRQAMALGIKTNDVLMQWDGVSIKDINHLKELVGTKGEGDPVRLVLIRAGRELKVELQIGKY